MKYALSQGENQQLPNKLGLMLPAQIGEQEFRGFLKASIYYQSDLTLLNSINMDLIHSIHKLALGHLYDFAGTLRTVNMSKGGFTFPAARFLHQACINFDNEWLKPLNSSFAQEADLVNHLAGLHAELLYIHPYREGNGRTARLFTNLVLIKHELPELNFDRITPGRMEEYIVAVQSAANKNYTPMRALFTELRT